MKLFFRIIFETVLILTILTGCATTDYNKAIELNPRDAEAYYNRGNTYYDKKQFDKAISDFTKAIEINPRVAEPYYNRGLAYRKKGQFDKAISDFTKAIEINPRHAVAYNNRGYAYFSKAITRRHGMMSIRRKIWDIQFPQDFLRTFVKPQVDKNNLQLTLIYLLLSYPKFALSNVQILSNKAKAFHVSENL